MGLQILFQLVLVPVAVAFKLSSVSIMAKELVPILLSCIVWGPILAKHRALFQCDNLSLVAAIHKGSPKDKVVMHLLRCLWFFITYFDNELNVEHIVEAINCTADQLSRIRCNPSCCYTHRCLHFQCPYHLSCYKFWLFKTWLDIHRLQQDIQRYYELDSASSTWDPTTLASTTT